MSRRLIGTQAQYLEAPRAAVTAPPFTFSAWYRSYGTNVASNNAIISVADNSVANHYYHLEINGSGQLRNRTCAGGSEYYAQSAALANNYQWIHAVGVWKAENPARLVYQNATHKGTDNTVVTPSNLNTTAIGRAADSTPSYYANMLIAHAAVWTVALTDDEIRFLAGGGCPYDLRKANLVFYEPLSPMARFPLDKSFGFTAYGTTLPKFDCEPPVNTHSLSKYIIVPTSAAINAKITAADAEVTYTAITGKVTAVDAEATYTTIAGKVTAADAEVTYNERAGKITAADAEVTYDERAGKITAADAEVTYDERGAKITASDAEVTYTPVTAQITAADAEVTYDSITAKITASDAEITYSETGAPIGKITAADAEITYTTVIGQVTAADAEVTYTTVEAKITASDAEITFDERGAKITASDAEITYTPVTGQITAVDAEVTHDTVVAKVTAADAEIIFNERAATITAADAEITYSIVSAGESATITAVDILITYAPTPGMLSQRFRIPGVNFVPVPPVPMVGEADDKPIGRPTPKWWRVK